jgi:predicted deacetylase
MSHSERKQLPAAVVTIHDACPSFSTRIFELADELERLAINYNIALVPFFNEKQDLRSFPEFVEQIKSYKGCEIALHGLYHEDKNGQFDDFHNISKAAAEEEIRIGLDIMHKIGIKTSVFIPPAWKLNDSSSEALDKLGFSLAETQERFILLSNKAFKKIKVPKVLNWDSTGYPEKNVVNIARDDSLFKHLTQQKSEIIRIALHPRDPVDALEDQKEMIYYLKDHDYIMQMYRDLIPNLQ